MEDVEFIMDEYGVARRGSASFYNHLIMIKEDMCVYEGSGLPCKCYISQGGVASNILLKEGPHRPCRQTVRTWLRQRDSSKKEGW